MGALLFRQLLPLCILFILPLRDAALLVTRLPWPEGGTKMKSKNKRNHLKVCDWLPIAASSLSSPSVTDLCFGYHDFHGVWQGVLFRIRELRTD